MILVSNILSICLAAYLIGYLIERKFSGEVGSLIRLFAAGIYVLAVVLKLLGVHVG